MIKTTIQAIAAACAVFLVLTASIGAAQQKSKGLRPLPKSNEEGLAFNAIACKVAMLEGADGNLQCPPNQKNEPEVMLKAADNFMKTFPASQLQGEALALKMDAYITLKDFDNAIDEYEKTRQFKRKYSDEKWKEESNKGSKDLQDLKEFFESSELDYLQRMMIGASNAGENKTARVLGDEILQRVPSHFPTLLNVAGNMASRPPKVDPKKDDAKEKAKEKQDHLDHAEEIGQLAVNYVMAFLEGPQSAEVKPADRDDLAYRAHSVMGLIYIQKEDYLDAQRAYQMAINLKKDNSLAYYYLGYALYQDKPQKTDAAIDALQKAAFLKGVTEEAAVSMLKQIYRNTKRPEADVEKDIKAAGLRLGK